MILSARNKIIILNLSMLIIMLTIIFFVLVPYVRNITKIKTYIEQTQEKLERRHNSVLESRKSMLHITDVENDIALFEQADIPTGGELEMIKKFEALAETHGLAQNLSPTYVDPSQSTKKTNDKKSTTATNPNNGPYYNLSIFVEGYFTDILSYLRDIEALPHYVILDKITWQYGNSTKNAPKLSRASLEVHVYAHPKITPAQEN